MSTSSGGFASSSSLLPPARPVPGRGLVRAGHPAPGRELMPTPAPASRRRRLGEVLLAPSPRLHSSSTSSTSNALASAMSAPTSPAPRALHQLRQPRRPTCPPQRRSSKRFRANQSLPDPVKWRTRRVTPFGKAGNGPQAVDPSDRPARAPGRNGFLAVDWPAPADGPRRPPPATIETSRLPAASPARLSPCRRWTPRPLEAGRRLPALPPFATLHDSESRQASAE